MNITVMKQRRSSTVKMLHMKFGMFCFIKNNQFSEWLIILCAGELSISVLFLFKLRWLTQWGQTKTAVVHSCPLCGNRCFVFAVVMVSGRISCCVCVQPMSQWDGRRDELETSQQGGFILVRQMENASDDSNRKPTSHFFMWEFTIFLLWESNEYLWELDWWLGSGKF